MMKKSNKKDDPLMSENIGDDPKIEVDERMTENKIEKELNSDIARTKAALEKEPKMPFIIPLTEGEKPGAEETVTINGYRQIIKKGVLVYVAKSVFDILANYHNVSATAGREMEISRSRDVEEALL